MSTTSLNTKRYVIGITGGIGGGKSLVRKMLEHMGCLTVDADRLAHQVYRRNSPAYHQIVKRWGDEILDQQGEIDRPILAHIVFSDPQALAWLEDITHPPVTAALQHLVLHAPLPIIAVEAIKLIKSGFSRFCDSVWLVDAPRDQVVMRLQKTRGTSAADIQVRLDSQSSLDEKKKHATARIENQGSVSDLWQQVCARWKDLSSSSSKLQRCMQTASEKTAPFSTGYLLPTMEAAEALARAISASSCPSSPSAAADGLLKWYDTGNFAGLTDLCFHLLCARHVWQYQPSADDSDYLMVDFQHFAGWVSLIATHTTDEKQGKFANALRRLEDFSQLHLIQTLMVCGNGQASVWEKYGYAPHPTLKERLSSGKAEYNVYSKNILPILDLFAEQEH